MAITDPRDISGLVAWYSAESITGLSDNTTMTAWNDISGNANHATVTVGAPKYRTTLGPGSGPCVHIDSGTFALPTGIMSGTGEILASFWSPGTIVGGLIDMGTSTDNNHFPYGGDLYDDFGSTVRKSQGGPIAASTWYRYAAMSKAGGWSSWLNGTAKYTTASNTTGWRSPLQIGASGSSYSGRTTFVVLYNRELTSGERADLDAWAVANPNGGTTAAPPPPERTAAFTGSGTLSASVAAVAAVAAAFTGVGVLTASAVPTHSVGADFNGGGTLSAAVSPVASTEANFTGSGTLSASIEVVAETPEVNAPFAGTGTLAATVVPVATAPADFSGTGTLTATAIPAFSVAAPFTGSGTLTADIVPVGTIISVGANFTGSGTLAATTTYVVNPHTDSGRISGRTRSGYGVATWFPPVVPLPPSDEGAKMLVAAAFGAQTMGGPNGAQPVYTISEAYTPRARQQIIVDGFDVSGFRDIVTPDVTYQLQEPLLYGPGDLTLPQVAVTEEFGTGDLWWLRPDATVIVNEVLDDVVVRTAYKGFINAFNIDGAHPVVELGGEAHGALEQMNRQPVVVPRVNDIGHQLAVDLDEAGIPHHPPLGRVTGIETLTTGGTGLLEHFQGVLAQGWTRAGRQWTVMPDSVTGVYETHRKDDATIHCTAFIDDARTVLNVRRDTSEEYNRVFGTGVTPRGMRVRNAVIPGLYQGPVPEFPGHMEIGDTGTGVQLLIGKLQAVNYLDLRDTPGGYDEDVAEAVVSLQIDAGFFEDGFTGTAVPGEVNLATWRALYDVDITQQSLAWARILPMAQRSRVKEWRRSGTGGILGPNPGYDATARKRDRNLEFGAGLTRAQMFEFSKADLQDANDPNWLGTATFHTGALLRGEVAIGQVITGADVLPAVEALPGHNLWVPNFQGGTLFHIAAAQVDVDGIVTVTIDTRFRDAPEVWEVMRRNKESKRDPARRANQRHRSSTITRDSIGEWYEHGGIIGNDVRLVPGWNVFEVIGAMSGTIGRFRLEVQTVTLDGETITIQGHEYACAVFGREISRAKLAQIVPAPLTADGKRNWRRKATRDQLKDHWILASFGNDEEPCGYGEDLKSDGATLTGVMDEDGGFPYRSESRTKLYIAVWVGDDADGATIPAGRAMWPQLESAV